MFPYIRIPSRPIRYAIIAAHTAREALDSINVDLTSVEQTLADQVESLSAKVDALQARLEAMDDSIDETPKPKAKRKPRAKKNAK
jgi:outer membrane murein-binding lipoprotein Lpp